MLVLIGLALAAVGFELIRIECLLSNQAEREYKEMGSIEQLQAEVQRNTSVQQSALVLIQGLAQQIKDAGTDPAKLDAIVKQLQTNDDALAAAVAANTPQAPPTPTV